MENLWMAYLAELRRLQELSGMVDDKAAMFAFITGLPNAVSRNLRTVYHTHVPPITLEQIAAQARVMMAGQVIPFNSLSLVAQGEHGQVPFS